MLATLICNDCGDAVSVTNRSITLPFVCDKCQAEIAKFEADIAPNATLGKLMTEPSVLEPSKESVDTTSLITDLAQQLNETTVARDNAFREAEVAIKEAEDLASRNAWQVGEINVLVDSIIAKDTQIVNQAGTIKRLEAQNRLTTGYAVQLAKELVYAAKRVFTLAAENGRLKAEIKLVTEERETAYASELALHNKLAQYITALDERKKEVKYQTVRADTFRQDALEQWKMKRDLNRKLEHPWKNLWKFYQDLVR